VDMFNYVCDILLSLFECYTSIISNEHAATIIIFKVTVSHSKTFVDTIFFRSIQNPGYPGRHEKVTHI